jgi:hypothetical protein
LKSILLILIGFAQSLALAQPEAETARTQWAAFTLGMTSLDAHLGWYNVADTPADLRFVAGYAFEGGVFLQGDVLWFAGGRSGFYGGAGLGIVAGNSFDLILSGFQLVLGGDIPLTAEGGLIIDSSLGFYPLILHQVSDPLRPAMIVPVFVRLGLGYRFAF